MLRRLATLSTIALPWLLGACNGNGPCDHDRALCEIQGLQINPTTIARTQLGAEATSLTVTTSKAWPVFSQNLHGTLVLGEDRVQLADATDPTSEYQPSLFPVRNKLTQGTYTFKISHPNRDLELSGGQPDPTLTITDDPVALAWKPHSQSPLTLAYPSTADASKGPVSVRGVWVGRPNGMNLAEVLLLRDYTNSSGTPNTQVGRSTDISATWPNVTAVQAHPSFFGLWPFGSAANPLAAYLTKGTTHFVSAAPLNPPQNPPQNPMSVDLKLAASAMAVVKSANGTIGLLVQTSSGLKGYFSSSNYVKPEDVASCVSTLKYFMGYADDPAGTSGVGVLGMTADGLPCFFDFNGAKFSENKTKSESLKIAMKTEKVTALAVGDVNGDGRNDIAVTRAGMIEFYLNQWWGFVPAKDSLALTTKVEPAAIAIGQMDGTGKNDLLVADGVAQMCGTPPTPCNHVHVYLNQTQ